MPLQRFMQLFKPWSGQEQTTQQNNIRDASHHTRNNVAPHWIIRTPWCRTLTIDTRLICPSEERQKFVLRSPPFSLMYSKLTHAHNHSVVHFTWTVFLWEPVMLTFSDRGHPPDLPRSLMSMRHYDHVWPHLPFLVWRGRPFAIRERVWSLSHAKFVALECN